MANRTTGNQTKGNTPNGNTGLALLTMSIGVFMAALDNGIVASSLSTLYRSFNVTPSWGAWIITIYTLGLAISLPIVGKLSDRYGRRLLFLIEIALFGIGSLLVASSINFPMFLASRFIQALGGGGIFILASSYILDTFPKEKHGRALGILGGMNGIASIIGPNLGAFLLDITGTWHWLFLINLPIAVLLLILGARTIHARQNLSNAKLDTAGILILSAASISLMYGLTQLKGANFLDNLTHAPFLVFTLLGVALAFLFLYMERKVSAKGIEPVLPVNLLKHPVYRITLLLALGSGGVLAAVIFIPSYVEQFLGVSSTQAGYWFTPLALASGIGAGGGGALIDRKGPVFTLLLAATLAIVGFALFPLWVASTWQMVVASCFVGLGFGMMLGAPINILATENAADNKGVALAGASLLRQMGLTIAPTLYAGFLTRSFLGFGDALQQKAADAGLSAADAISHMPTGMATAADPAAILAAAEQIPSPQARQLVQQTLHETIGRGYAGLFWSALVISALMFVAVLAVRAARNRSRQPERAS
jgi:EmrB/QacA subfamily drug resistance transporter